MTFTIFLSVEKDGLQKIGFVFPDYVEGPLNLCFDNSMKEVQIDCENGYWFRVTLEPEKFRVAKRRIKELGYQPYIVRRVRTMKLYVLTDFDIVCKNVPLYIREQVVYDALEKIEMKVFEINPKIEIRPVWDYTRWKAYEKFPPGYGYVRCLPGNNELENIAKKLSQEYLGLLEW